MSKRTVLVILTELFVDETLTIFGFVSGWMIELLNFVMGVLAVKIIARSQFALDMAITYLTWITSFITLIVKEPTTGQLMQIR